MSSPVSDHHPVESKANSFSAKSLLTNRIWEFGRRISLPGGRADFDRYGSVVLDEDGRIKGYTHPNEASWATENNKLYFLNVNGEVTSTFEIDFSGKPMLGDSAWNIPHYLRPAPSAAIRIPYNKGMDDLARRGKFFFKHYGGIDGVYNSNSVISVFPNAIIEPGATMPEGSIFAMGKYSYMAGAFSHHRNGLKIGRYCSIAIGLKLFGDSHPTDWVTSHPMCYSPYVDNLLPEGKEIDFPPKGFFTHSEAITEIGNDVWIGEDVLLKPGLKIGDGAIIAARSIVTKDVPPYAVCAGAPASIRKFRFAPAIIERLRDVAWWQYDLNGAPIVWDDIELTLDNLERARDRGLLRELHFEPIDWAVEFLKVM